jgi:tRNA modification GTPase
MAGEFTRRAFENGRVDLAEAEGLADLLAAETQSQRRAALALAGGMLSRKVEAWQGEVLRLAGVVEAVLDFGDEGDVEEELPASWSADIESLRAGIAVLLRQPTVDRLRDGIRLVIAGPPNAGKSTLLNHLAGRDAAITAPMAGTTRDVIEAPTSIGGVPCLLTDTAGLRESEDEVEAIGVERARERLQSADIILWLGPPEEAPESGRTLLVQSKADIKPEPAEVDARISPLTGDGMDRLVALILERAKALIPGESDATLNERHRAALAECSAALDDASASPDLLIKAEALRQARIALHRITGRAGVEDMLDNLFGRFCIGK